MTRQNLNLMNIPNPPSQKKDRQGRGGPQRKLRLLAYNTTLAFNGVAKNF